MQHHLMQFFLLPYLQNRRLSRQKKIRIYTKKTFKLANLCFIGMQIAVSDTRM